MIISKTPLRVSFVGGGSDMESYYKHHGGAVVSTSIDKYIYLCANRRFDPGYRLSYSTQEMVTSIDEIQHHLIRECFKYFKLEHYFDFSSIADIPSSGSGLGSSSSFTVGLVNLLAKYKGLKISARKISEIACEIEIDKCGSPIGKQDQYAAAIGGMNKFVFNNDGSTEIEPVDCDPKFIKAFNNSIIVFYTGKSRDANKILSAQNSSMKDVAKQTIVSKMVELCDPFVDRLRKGDIKELGEILDLGWSLKKSIMDSISNPDIDKCYKKARSAGAVGGKLLGAGQQGFLLFSAPPSQHSKIEIALEGLRRVYVNFEDQGTYSFVC